MEKREQHGNTRKIWKIVNMQRREHKIHANIYQVLRNTGNIKHGTITRDSLPLSLQRGAKPSTERRGNYAKTQKL